MRTVQLQTKLVNSTAKTISDIMYLVEREETKINVPFLDIDSAMRGICNTINTDLNLLCAFLRSLFSYGFNNIFDGNDGSEDIRGRCERYDARA